MKRAFLLLLVLLLNACVGIQGNTSPGVVYDFGLPAMRPISDVPWSRMALEVRSPSWFDSVNVDYRLAYEDPLKRYQYAGSRWAASPASLIAQRLRQQLGAVSTTGNTTVNCLLRVELQEFSQVFDSPQQSRGVLQGRVSLIDSRQRILAERPVFLEIPAKSSDAHGGVIALVAANAALGQQLAKWLENQKDDSSLKNCR